MLLSVTEVLRIAKADSKSSVLILLDLSAALTLSIIRSSCPPSHHWASLGLHFTGLNPISLVGLSRCPGKGRYPKHINWSLGFLRVRFLDPSYSPHTLHHWVPSYRHMASPTSPTSLQHDFTIQIGSSTITHSSSFRNLGVIFDDQLTFKDHITKTARSCRFALHNIRKIRPFLTEHAAQLLVQALVVSRLDYCNALLAGLPSNTIKPLQMIQNAAARLVFNEHKRAHVTPLFISLHWLPVAARSLHTEQPQAQHYFHSLLRIYIPPDV